MFPAISETSRLDPTLTLTSSLSGFMIDNGKSLLLAGAISGSLLAHGGMYAALRKFAARTDWEVDDEMIRKSRWPTLILFPTVTLKILYGDVAAFSSSSFFSTADTDVDASTTRSIRQTLTILILFEIAWLCLRMLDVGFQSLARKNVWPGTSNATESWKRRKTMTQLAVFKRLCYVVVVTTTIAAAWFTFPGAWEFGTSMMAGAGAAGLLLGLSAKPGFQNIISSLTIAFGQAITLDDELMVGTEWGRVEEIKAQYVVLRTWDGRRLIIPITFFTTTSFENWTKTSTWKIGASFLYFDPLIIQHLDRLRDRLAAVLTTAPEDRKLWDGKVTCVQVTDVDEGGVVQVRVLTSARNPQDAFDLRCVVRESLIAYVVEMWPECLVRQRGECRHFEDEMDEWNRGWKAMEEIDEGTGSSAIDKENSIHSEGAVTGA